MKTKIKKFLFGTFILVATQYFMGCCMIGLAIGASKDAKKPDYTSIEAYGVHSTKESIEEMPPQNHRKIHNQTVFITTRNGDEHSGKYLAMVKQDNQTYVQINRYGEKRLIATDEIIFLQTKDEMITLKRNTLDVHTREKGIVKGKFQRVFMDNDRTYMEFESNGKLHRIAMDDISSIQVKNKKNGALQGFLVGAVIDFAVVVAVTYAVNEPLGDMTLQLE